MVPGFRRCASCLRCFGGSVPKLFSPQNASGTGKRFFCVTVKRHGLKVKLAEGPDLKHFLGNVRSKIVPSTAETDSYLQPEDYLGNGCKVHFVTYGCQMNVNDVEVVRSVMLSSGYVEASELKQADVVMIMTCSIREGAEQKVWQLLKMIKAENMGESLVCVLGCMAERLKQTLLSDSRLVNVVAGPDSYRDLPRLVAVARRGDQAMNVQLSLEETYADVAPVRANAASKTAFVSIMRGCDNMCTYCIVPFTRGRERSRPMTSILEEIRRLSDQGVKQVTLLGQNVNSYRDNSELISPSVSVAEPDTAPGFRTIYRPKTCGRSFVTLLDEVSKINPEMRIRFTSPHPKDFPLKLIQLISERSNLCEQLHLPAQSGSDAVLERMGRGYSVQAYLELAENIRRIIPDVSLTSDFIAGFCGETDDDHQDTLNLIRKMKYAFCYVFPYSMREKTRANYRLQDDVPKDVKQRRHTELASTFREEAAKLNELLIGSTQLALIEGESRRSRKALTGKALMGRLDGGVKVIIGTNEASEDDGLKNVQAGDYVAVRIVGATSQTVRGKFLEVTSLRDFYARFAQTRCK